MNNPLPPKDRTTEYLANERTFLAWVRTSIAVISLGFVVAKFSVWMHELAVRLTPGKPIPSTGMSMPIGIAMMAFGGLLAVLAAWHYHCVNRAIERGDVRANRALVLTVTLAIALLTALMITYMILTSEQL